MNIRDSEIRNVKRYDIIELQDFEGTLKQFKDIVDNLIDKYRDESLILFDAGHNNISAIVFVKK